MKYGAASIEGEGLANLYRAALEILNICSSVRLAQGTSVYSSVK